MTVNGGEINDTMDSAILPGRWTVAVPGNDLSNPPELRNPATLWGFLDVYLQADGQWIMQVFSPSGTSEDAGYVYVRKNINSAIITVVGYAVIGGIGISSMCMFISS